MSSSRSRSMAFRIVGWWVPIVLVAVLVPSATSIPAEDPAPAAAKKLGILVFPGVQVIDFAGPYEVLSGASSGRPARSSTS